MAQIRISPETMRTRASQYRNQADNVADVITAMSNLLTELQSEWEGAASDAYAAKYAELEPGFKEAESLIRDIADALDATATAVEDTDSTIAGSY